MISATYSPEDDKIRLYPSERLDQGTYSRVKAAGYGWAPKQECFYAVWSPDREDLAEELAGEIGDEDKSLVERAEERAERFQGYSESRREEAAATRDAAQSLAGGIPLGQPILIGHHSEARARRDAERIQNGVLKAVRLWETAGYWKSRAAGALRAAKYKELPAVRARRIKGLEADRRKQERNRAEADFALRFWRGEVSVKKPSGEKRVLPIVEEERALICHIIGSDPRLGYLPVMKHPTLDQSVYAWDVLRPDGERYASYPAMPIAEVQAKALAQYPRHIARADRWIAHIDNRLAYERAMLAEAGGLETDKTRPEKGGAVRCLWSPGHGRGWAYVVKVNKVSVSIRFSYNSGGRLFSHLEPFDKIREVMSKAEVDAARAAGRIHETEDGVGFFLLDEAPAPTPAVSAPDPEKAQFQALAAAAAAGVQTVFAPQLFPTPPELAQRMAEELRPEPGSRILEPSAGTGRLLTPLAGHSVVAVEIVPQLAARLRETFPGVDVRSADFLACNGDLGTFDRIIMNPPFRSGDDMKHIRHAVGFLRPGGRLVALCADGPRQSGGFREWIESQGGVYEPLPEGSFAEEGTQVRVAMVTLDR